MAPLFKNSHSDPPPIEPVSNVFPKINGADIAAVTLGERVAGDFYDSIRAGPERVLFGLLDLAGRRETNRDILTAAQDIFRTLGAELFAPSDVNESNAMTELCLQLNRHILEASTDVHSCPAFIACYHEKFGTLCYTNAGHTPGLLRDSTGITELQSTGLPLGLFSHATCEAPTIGTEKGSVLLLVSRGVVDSGDGNPDSADQNAEEYGLDRVKQTLQTAPPGTAHALCASILNAATEFHAGKLVAADATALAFIRRA